MMDLKAIFTKPSTEYRSKPFWAWNDKLNKEELTRQLKDMKVQGMGGVFIHSREGLETEYLSDEWMDCVKETVKISKEEGMEVWIYDEDKWPSGAAGGKVSSQNREEYTAKAITLEVTTNYKFSDKDKDVLAVFKILIKRDNICRYEKINAQDDNSVTEGESILVFRREISASSEWYNGSCPSDNLNSDSVKAFIDMTHEKYKKQFGNEFGQTIKGFFSDEANIADFFCKFTEGRPWLPWSDELQQYFLKNRGYDILENVLWLFYNGEKSPKIRHDYWRTISEKFSEAYSKQIGEWCEENNVLFTGHFLFENDLGYASRVNGAVMPQYRYMHIPGIDILGEMTKEYLTVKQCTSVANQYARKGVMSEIYGCTGWDFSFEGQRWLGDWQYVMGVNLRCQHLALYSIKGLRKRDYPPSFNYNTSWWKYNNIIENYFARLGAMTSAGKVVRDILVIHPATTIWTITGCSPMEDLNKIDEKMGWTDSHITKVNKIGEKFNILIKSILTNHYDLDIGDETIIMEEGNVKPSEFVVNQVSYSTVIIPPVTTLFQSTLNLLQEFLKVGGRVIAVKPTPFMLEGEENDGIKEFFKQKSIITVENEFMLNSVLEANLPRKVSILNKSMLQASDFLYMLREIDDSKVLFVINNDRNNAHEVLIELNGIGKLEEWNALTREIKEIDVKISENKVSFVSKFGSADSKIFVLNSKEQPSESNIDFSYNHPHETKKIYTSLGPVCKFTRTMQNALILDKCKFRIKEEEWSEEIDIWRAQKSIRKSLEMKQVFENGVTQRYKWINNTNINDGTPVQFKLKFNVTNIPDTDIYLVLECSENFEITLNKEKIDNKPCGWFMDKNFHKIKLAQVKIGENELILSCNYLNKMEVEDCYIIGDFGVDINRNIIKEPETLHLGDWCMQGYFHYCGSIIYHFDFNYNIGTEEKAIIEVGEFSAVIIEIRVNATTVAYIPWKSANRVDITKYLKEGSNNIDFEVMASPRNIFGPFHQVRTDYTRIDWSDFRTQGNMYTPDYVVKPYGLFGQINICIE